MFKITNIGSTFFAGSYDSGVSNDTTKYIITSGSTSQNVQSKEELVFKDLNPNTSYSVVISTIPKYTDYVYSLYGSGSTPTFFSGRISTSKYTITFPTTIKNVTSIDFSRMASDVYIANTTTFNGASLNISVYDDSDNLVGSQTSSTLGGLQTQYMSTLGEITLKSVDVKYIVLSNQTFDKRANISLRNLDVNVDTFRVTTS